MGCVELGAAAAMDPCLMGLNLPVLGIFRGTGVPMGVSGWYPKVPPLWLQGGEYFGHPDPFLPIPNGFSPPTSSHQHTCGALGCITEVQVSLPLPLLTFSPTSLSFFFSPSPSLLVNMGCNIYCDFTSPAYLFLRLREAMKFE